MNQRIEQLAEQCWTHTNEPLFSAKSPHWEFDRRKFAELIVQECVNVLHDNELWNRHISHALKEHFGVEQ